MPSPRKSIRLRLPVGLWTALGTAAEQTGLSTAELIRRAIRADLERAAPPPRAPRTPKRRP